jgi:hypothetical protein
MKRRWVIAAATLFFACTKQVGENPSFAYSNKALFDSCVNGAKMYYKNSSILLPATGAHGEHKLRFNSIAFTALTDSGKLPATKVMPEGSLIVKDSYSGGTLDLYAFMYKKSSSWLWAEIKPNGEVVYSVNKNPDGCIGCHSQSGNRDMLLSFK